MGTHASREELNLRSSFGSSACIISTHARFLYDDQSLSLQPFCEYPTTDWKVRDSVPPTFRHPLQLGRHLVGQCQPQKKVISASVSNTPWLPHRRLAEKVRNRRLWDKADRGLTKFFQLWQGDSTGDHSVDGNNIIPKYFCYQVDEIGSVNDLCAPSGVAVSTSRATLASSFLSQLISRFPPVVIASIPFIAF